MTWGRTFTTTIIRPLTHSLLARRPYTPPDCDGPTAVRRRHFNEPDVHALDRGARSCREAHLVPSPCRDHWSCRGGNARAAPVPNAGARPRRIAQLRTCAASRATDVQ